MLKQEFIHSLFLCLAIPALGADTYFPLAAGNRWEYRARDGQSWTITVGTTPLLKEGQVYHRVTGYLSRPAWMRQDGSGTLYMLDADLEQDVLVTRFQPGERFESPAPQCRQLAEASAKAVTYYGLSPEGTAAQAVNYEGGCPDAAFDEELYVANVGLVRRTVSVLSGPRVYELVRARVGNLMMTADPVAYAQLMLPRTLFQPIEASGSIRIPVTLRVGVFRMGGPVKLRFPSSQRFDAALRNAAGEQVYRWSLDKIFLPVVFEEWFEGEREYSFWIELPALGSSIPDGIYELEAWVMESERRFAATGRVEIRSQAQR